MRFLLAVFIMLGGLVAADAASWNDFRKKPDEWFKTDEAKAIAANVLAWQTEQGDWPNDNDSFAPFKPDAKTKQGTFDDGHTTHEARFLVRMFAATGREEYRDAALKAIDLVMDSQYGNGGFPQQARPTEKYPKYITFNDRTMVNLLELLRDVSTRDEFNFAGDDRRLIAGRQVDAGVRCILASQIRMGNSLQVWGAQHDERTLAPRPARAFEPASFASAESADVLVFLMSFENPSPEVIDAVDAGFAWFQRTQLRGIRVEKSDGDAIVVRDPSAPPIWARFYDLNTMRPMFAGRDGVVKSTLAEIDQERRTGYAWFGNWGEKVVKSYAKWPDRPKASSDVVPPDAK
ncbi:MAG: pectate lyase [Planctomycetaceae bacterium]|nr:pectate lyase [Planctomycetaceae bacterium]